MNFLIKKIFLSSCFVFICYSSIHLIKIEIDARNYIFHALIALTNRKREREWERTMINIYKKHSNIVSALLVKGINYQHLPCAHVIEIYRQHSRYVRSYQVNVKYISYVKSNIAILHHFEKYRLLRNWKYIVCADSKKGTIFYMFVNHFYIRYFLYIFLIF